MKNIFWLTLTKIEIMNLNRRILLLDDKTKPSFIRIPIKIYLSVITCFKLEIGDRIIIGSKLMDLKFVRV